MPPVTICYLKINLLLFLFDSAFFSQILSMVRVHICIYHYFNLHFSFFIIYAILSFLCSTIFRLYFFVILSFFFNIFYSLIVILRSSFLFSNLLFYLFLPLFYFKLSLSLTLMTLSKLNMRILPMTTLMRTFWTGDTQPQ